MRLLAHPLVQELIALPQLDLIVPSSTLHKCAILLCVILFSAIKNPFEFGRELGVEEIVDRDAEVAEVVQTIDNGGKLFMIGPRRYGKTSILKAAEDRLRSGGAVVVRFDAESYPSLDLLVNAIVAGAARHLKGSIERTGEQIRKFFAKLRPELNFSVTEREWTAKVGVTPVDSTEHHVTLLVETLDGMEELARAQPRNRSVGLIIDEFQKIIEHIGVVSNDPTIVIAAHLQLARAWALSGYRDKAKSVYEDFLKLWKDADPDIPILKQARAEHERL